MSETLTKKQNAVQKNYSNPHGQYVTMKRIQLPSGEWSYSEFKTFENRENGEKLFTYCFKRNLNGRYPLTFRVRDFSEDLSWCGINETPYGYYKIGNKKWYPSRAKALSAVRRHFKSEEWDGDANGGAAFAIYPERDKDGNLIISKKGTPQYCVAIDWNNADWASIDHPSN